MDNHVASQLSNIYIVVVGHEAIMLQKLSIILMSSTLKITYYAF